MAAFTRCRHETTEFETVTLTVQVSCNNFVLTVVNRNDFLPIAADLTVSKRPGTSYRIKIHFAVFNHLYLLFSFMKLVEIW